MRLLAGVVLLLAFQACTGVVTHPEVPVAAPQERQILVMLRVAPPHYRPEASYTGSYSSRFGREALDRIARGLADEHKLKVVSDWPMPALGVQCYVMELPPDESASRLITVLLRDPRVESAEQMQEFHVLGHNDPLYPLQPSASLWHLADVHEVATGRNVVVAEIDTGVEIDHPDLAGQIIATENFVDGRPYTPEAHGTAVAGIIAAIADNRLGIAGVAPQARLMVLRGCWQEQAGGSARCNSFTLAKALQFALDKKPDVINMSLGGPPDRLLSRLLDAAVERGMVVVAAIDPSRADSFPASHPGVLAVASEDAGMPASGVLVAPGRDVPTTMTGRRWDFVQGSSYAAAHVTGVVALLRQLSPASDARRIRESLQPPQAHPAADRAQMMDVCALVTRAADVCVCACGAARQASAIQVR